MNRKLKDNPTDVARLIAPEDIRPGIFVCIHKVVIEDQACAPDGVVHPPVPMLWLPGGAGPLRVLAVCLPFFLVIDADGDTATLDTRRYRLARVTKEFGKAAFRHKREEEERKRRKS